MKTRHFFFSLVLACIFSNCELEDTNSLIIGKPISTENHFSKFEKNYLKDVNSSIEITGIEDIPSSNISEEKKFLDILNRARKKMGMSVLKMDENLCRAARFYSNHMAINYYFKHDSYIRDESFKLKKLSDKFERIYKFAPYLNGGGCGENIAAGNFSANDTYNQWYNSPGHYSKMFDPKYKIIGIGYVKNEDSDHTHYWTTDFGYAASGIAY